MKREHIKTGLIILLLLMVLILIFILYRAAKSIRFQDEELQAAREANEALQSEIDHYEENAAKNEIESVLQEEVSVIDPPQLGGSLKYKIQVLRSGPGLFEAWITGKQYRILLSWNNLENHWTAHRQNADELYPVVNGDDHNIECALNDSATLSREIHQLLTKADVCQTGISEK